MTTAVGPGLSGSNGTGARAAREAQLASLLGLDLRQAAALRRVGDAEIERWVSLLGRYQQACGCKSGGALAMTALALWPIVAFRSGARHSVVGALARWTAAGAGGAVTGKAAGLAGAAVAKRLAARRIAARLAQPSAP